MRQWIWGIAGAAMLAAATASDASIVTFELEVNGSGSGASVQVGDTIAVSIYATVTQNTHTIGGNPTNLGLASYGLNLFTNDLRMEAVEGTDIFLQPDGQWAVTYFVPMATHARGNVVNGAVHGHGAVESTFTQPFIATTRELLATGCFTAIAPGAVNVRIGGQIAARVFTYTTGIGTAAADTIVFSPTGVPVTVVPEPAAAALLGLAFLAACRPRRQPMALR